MKTFGMFAAASVLVVSLECLFIGPVLLALGGFKSHWPLITAGGIMTVCGFAISAVLILSVSLSKTRAGDRSMSTMEAMMRKAKSRTK